jgi:hypothetical protein
MPTGLKVVEAQAAPVTAMATAEKTLIFGPTVKTPNKTDILDAIGVASMGDMLEKNFSALGTNGTKFFQIFYDYIHDEFFSHELTRAENDSDINADGEAQLVLKSSSNVGSGLNRNEIESIIIENGYNMPQRDITFIIVDSANSVFRVSFLNELDEYAYEKLAVRV